MTEKDWKIINCRLYNMDRRWDADYSLMDIIAKFYPDKVRVSRDLKYPTYLWKDREYCLQKYSHKDPDWKFMCPQGYYAACNLPHTSLQYVDVLRDLDLSDMNLFKLLGLNCFGFVSEEFQPERNLSDAIDLLINFCGLRRHPTILHCPYLSKEKIRPIWERFARDTHRMDLYYLISYLRPDLDYSDCLKLYKAIKSHYSIPTVATEDAELGYTDRDKYVELYMQKGF